MVLLLTSLLGVNGAQATTDVINQTSGFQGGSRFGETVVFNYEDHDITDDSIAESIKAPRPRSLSDVCKEIFESSSKSVRGTLINVDLSSNTICDEGAATLVRKFVDLPLESLDVSWNRMTDEGIQTLIVGLKTLLLKPTFKTLDIRGNYGANATCMRKLPSLLTSTEYSGIIGKITF